MKQTMSPRAEDQCLEKIFTFLSYIDAQWAS